MSGKSEIISPENFPVIEKYEGKYKRSDEYVGALREWTKQVYQQQCFSAAMPYLFAANLMQAQKQQQQQSPSTSTGASAQQPGQQSQSAAGRTNPNTTTAAGVPRVGGTEYVVPSLWKRFMAEMIDFFLLFMMKMTATYIAFDFFDLLDIENPLFESLNTDALLTDYRATMNMTWDILVLETIYRIGNCVFEALCLHRGRRGVGGATPGKKLMGLKVVRCNWVGPTLNNQVIVHPANDIGIGRAAIRAIIKNVSITFLFPLCLTMLIYQHNRFFYDIISECIVVEEIPPHRRNVANNNRN